VNQDGLTSDTAQIRQFGTCGKAPAVDHGVRVEGVRSAQEAVAALSSLQGDEVVLLLSSGPLLGLPDTLPPVFDRLYGAAVAA